MSIVNDSFPIPRAKLSRAPKVTFNDWEGLQLKVMERHDTRGGAVEFQIYRVSGPCEGLVFDMEYEDVKRLREVLTFIMTGEVGSE